jgi:hypothetical protein
MRAYSRWMLLTLALVLSVLALADVRDTQAQAIPLGNHYKCYDILNPVTVTLPLTLVDQFGSQTATTATSRFLCNPVKKNTSGIPNPNLHYVCYNIAVPAIPVRSARVTNQFHTMDVRVQQARLLCLPSSKTLLTP